ncbi:MAG: UvrD-helicase domain-containing protein [Rickettsiales bacterium]|jgi:DNA helicase-2/ATP-dependent DNA helicase PcrA|nr:UvrD-helicase domain-containing protein [Rickettsiales bacterium]
MEFPSRIAVSPRREHEKGIEMFFYADLHIHSKYSRATSKSCNLEELALWAEKKGLGVISTGDFTHPAWFAEIKEKLVSTGDGVFKLKDGNSPIRFILSVEISTIYKKGDKTRKVHHVVFVPDLAAAEKFRGRLAAIGNIASDGRPILGLDSRNLLEIALDAGDGSYIIPAHIWTPWFSVLGSKSGFDSIGECYGDLAQYIFAVETGLSSDPEMNWRVSSLDKYRLVSNSDAHSPANLAREATVFDGEPDYFGIMDALKTGDGYVGTVEFFPEEGKYHEDGHRKCDIRLAPEETARLGGICPVCGKPLTIGVLNRVNELADRKGDVAPPPKAGQVFSLVPLREILAEIMQVGATSKSVVEAYENLIRKLGSELGILRAVPVEDISNVASPLLAEAVLRLRQGKVIRQAGFDGEYGVIRLFEDGELKSKKSGGLLFDIKAPETKRRCGPEARKSGHPSAPTLGSKDSRTSNPESLWIPVSDTGMTDAPAPRNENKSLDERQQDAVEDMSRQLLIVAGPGSGKTAVLTRRIARFVSENIMPPENCLAITFTRRAAEEMKSRLKCDVNVHTFHSLCFSILKENHEAAGLEPDFKVSAEPDYGALSFDDLIVRAVLLLDGNPALADSYRERYRYVSVDEYQDIDAKQYELIRLLASSDGYLCAIGDPNQSIYSFRGGDSRFFKNFAVDYPDARIIGLENNYRSTGTIVDASNQMIGSAETKAALDVPHEKIAIHAAPTEKAEAEFVVKTIEGLIGGHSFYSIDTGRAGGEDGGLSFSDFAVLYRTSSQLEPLVEAFARSGMPFAKLSEGLLCENKEVKKFLQALVAGEPLVPQVEKFEGDEHVRQYLLGLARDCAGKDEFVGKASLLSEIDTLDRRADRISLMTLHASKGLEFKCVFVVGLENGLLPFYRAEDVEEERRLLYVGMTRAERRLFLTRALRRKQYGTYKAQEPSPFLEKIERELLSASKSDGARRKKSDGGQMSLL